MRRYSFFISDDLKRGLEALNARDGMPESEAIRRALADFLKRCGISVTNAPKGGKRTKTK